MYCMYCVCGSPLNRHRRPEPLAQHHLPPQPPTAAHDRSADANRLARGPGPGGRGHGARMSGAGRQGLRDPAVAVSLPGRRRSRRAAGDGGASFGRQSQSAPFRCAWRLAGILWLGSRRQRAREGDGPFCPRAAAQRDRALSGSARTQNRRESV